MSWTEACWNAVRLAAFALAICSRSAADDFLNWGEVSPEAADCTVVADDTAERLSSPEAVVEDFCEAFDPFRKGLAGGMDVFTRPGVEGFLRLFRDGRAWTVRADCVLDPFVGVPALRLGFSGLGVRERGSRALEGDAILERKVPFNPTVEGVFIKVPMVRPRTGVPLVDFGGDGKEPLIEVSGPGPELEPGRLSEGNDGGSELSERRRNPAREPRLLAGLDVDLIGSASKKLELDTLLRKAGDGCKCDSVSMVLSAKDGRGFRALARFVSSLVSASAAGLFRRGDVADTQPVDTLLTLGVRCLA